MKHTFDNKIKSMTAYEIIMAMVNGLRNAHVNVDMSTFGESQNSVCFGCAATNIICEIFGGMIPASHIDLIEDRANYVDADMYLLDEFESSIDYLRYGDIEKYNFYAVNEGFVIIKNPNNIDLPILGTDTYMDNLEPYIQLAHDNL